MIVTKGDDLIFSFLFINVDPLDEISKSNKRDIVIQLDNSISWLEHVKMFDGLMSSNKFFEYAVKEKPKSEKGSKCYLAHYGKIQGYVEIHSIKKKNTNFNISMFPYIIVRDGRKDFLFFEEQYRYFFDNSSEQ